MSALAFRFWPRGLAGQLILATVAVLLIAQGVVVAIALHERRERFERETGDFMARRIALVADLLRTTPPELHSHVLRIASAPGFRFEVRERPAGLPPAPFFEAWLGPHLRSHGLTGSVVFRLPPGHGGMRGDHHHKRGGLVAVPVKVAAQDTWLTMSAHRNRAPPWPGYALASLFLAAAGSALVIALIVGRASRPLARLTGAAERVGRGESVPPLREEGPSDIRTTIAAFNRMQERLHRFVQDRTRMLAAISHDLRSPITALRLRAEMVEQEDLRESMIASLNEMQQMVDATLAFARDDSAKEETQTADLAAIAAEAASIRAEQGHDVAWKGGRALQYPCRPLALKRAIGNLIDNAVRYAGSAEVSLEGTSVVIRDGGPGIPEDRLGYVFEPFARLDESRSAETGGTGLGLAIARSITRNHGGDVTLRNRPGGGLEARLVLPLAA